MENLSGILIPVGTILLVVLLQISFWLPVETKRPEPSDNSKEQQTASTYKEESKNSPKPVNSKQIKSTAPNFSVPTDVQCVFITEPTTSNNKTSELGGGENKNAPPTIQEGRIWKCACELGILPAGILKTFGNAEAMMRLGVGQCYHKK